MSAIASSERQLSQAARNSSLAGDLPDDGLLDLAGAHRDRHAADGDRGARDLAAVDLQQRRRRDDGEIAVAAGELDEGAALCRAGQSGMRIAVTISFSSMAGVR